MSDPLPGSNTAPHRVATDLRGASRLAIEATIGLTNLVENLHHNISRAPLPLGAVSTQATSGITGLVYRSIRGVTRLVGGTLDGVMGQLARLLGPAAGAGSAERDALLAVLNGVLGDHLQASANPLAIRMQLMQDGRPLPAAEAASALAGRRVLLLIHGLCMQPAHWQRKGHHHGTGLAAAGSFTLLHLHYNTGLHIADNGLQLADLLQGLHTGAAAPPTEIVMLCHSMGGLVARSALHQAQQRGDDWPRQLTKMVFLGTPHHGAPLERGGHWIDRLLDASPYTSAFARLGRLRSAGITDLRHGSLLYQDRPRLDGATAGSRDTHAPMPVPLPLPSAVACYTIAGSLGRVPGELREKLLGDGIVPLASALGQHRLRSRRLDFEPDHQWLAQGVGHLDLLSDPGVYSRMRQWLVARPG